MMSDIRANRDESLEEIVRFYEKIIQTQKKTNQSLLNENIRLRAKMRNNYVRNNEEIIGSNFLFTTPPPHLSQIRRVKFQPKLSPIAQSPESERISNSKECFKNKDSRSVYVQTENQRESRNEFCMKGEAGGEGNEKSKREKKTVGEKVNDNARTEVEFDKKRNFNVNLRKECKNKTETDGVESGEMKENINSGNNLTGEIKKKYPLRENSRCVSYKVPSLRVKLRRDTEKPEYNPFKTHNYFNSKKQ